MSADERARARPPCTPAARRRPARLHEPLHGRRHGDDLPAPAGVPHRGAQGRARVPRPRRGRRRHGVEPAEARLGRRRRPRRRSASRWCSSATASRARCARSSPSPRRPWHVLAVRVTDRVGKGIRSSPRDALIADAAGDRAGRAFGFHQAMDNAGAVVGPLVATGLIALQLLDAQRLLDRRRPRGDRDARSWSFVREPPRARADRVDGADAAAGPRVLTPTLISYLGILALFSLGNSSDAFLLLRARALGLTTAEIPVLWSVLNAVQGRLGLARRRRGRPDAARAPRRRRVARLRARLPGPRARDGDVARLGALRRLRRLLRADRAGREGARQGPRAAPSSAGARTARTTSSSASPRCPPGCSWACLWHAWGPAHALEVGAGLAAVVGRGAARLGCLATAHALAKRVTM